mmetsp:Transcript_83470/g.232851  ORF Transcript_83470/g.232851 Transcript_83470/m.232851 type:complete len:373 (+) Transcript_83470:1127-2245(+)
MRVAVEGQKDNVPAMPQQRGRRLLRAAAKRGRRRWRPAPELYVVRVVRLASEVALCSCVELLSLLNETDNLLAGEHRLLIGALRHGDGLCGGMFLHCALRLDLVCQERLLGRVPTLRGLLQSVLGPDRISMFRKRLLAEHLSYDSLVNAVHLQAQRRTFSGGLLHGALHAKLVLLRHVPRVPDVTSLPWRVELDLVARRQFPTVVRRLASIAYLGHGVGVRGFPVRRRHPDHHASVQLELFVRVVLLDGVAIARNEDALADPVLAGSHSVIPAWVKPDDGLVARKEWLLNESYQVRAALGHLKDVDRHLSERYPPVGEGELLFVELVFDAVHEMFQPGVVLHRPWVWTLHRAGALHEGQGHSHEALRVAGLP